MRYRVRKMNKQETVSKTSTSFSERLFCSVHFNVVSHLFKQRVEVDVEVALKLTLKQR